MIEVAERQMERLYVSPGELRLLSTKKGPVADKSSPEYWYLKGVSYFLAQKADSAEISLTKAISLDLSCPPKSDPIVS